MRILPISVLLVSLSARALIAQARHSGLEASYGHAIERTYDAGDGARVTAFDGYDGEICALTISGALSEQQVESNFEKMVATATRGRLLIEMMQCLGPCQLMKDFDNLIFTSMTVEGQISTPSAIIVFKAKPCEEVAAKIRAKGFTELRLKSQGVRVP